MTNDSVPPVIYASLSIIAAFLIINLPETKGRDLPDTLLEAERIKDQNMEDGISQNSELEEIGGCTSAKVTRRD